MPPGEEGLTDIQRSPLGVGWAWYQLAPLFWVAVILSLWIVCRSCLVKYLEENNTCPTCRIVIHQSHPLQYIGHDRTMQDIVYKLVPGLQEAEMRKQREFYHKLGMEVPGDIKGEACSAKQHLDPRNGETKAEDSSNKETAEEKQEEDNDYHRSDEQVKMPPL
ncbi:hypothetical protein A6R68_04993 [Neotoma lepida]|uniref:RING-type domain-containing protein n=1 Tax=Neotoma lepida TaxID=56216 RepID=A0A1A6GMA2_NEOLE|nr:hypothetical protein A6R68_04993 [Neotoma lepida]